MRAIMIAADVAMGVFLGAFLYAALTRIWPALQHGATAGLVLVAAILIVLFRRPHGAFAPGRDRS
jgi:hypothetical protein